MWNQESETPSTLPLLGVQQKAQVENHGTYAEVYMQIHVGPLLPLQAL